MLLEKILKEIQEKYNINDKDILDIKDMFLQYGLAMHLSRSERKQMYKTLKEKYQK